MSSSDGDARWWNVLARCTVVLGLLFGIAAASSAVGGAAPAHGDARSTFGDEDAARAVRLLLARCVECHGPTRNEGELRVDSRAALLTGGATGPALIEGAAAKSELFLRITSTFDFERMPLDQTALAQTEVDLFQRWIDAGAPWPASLDVGATHWAFAPLRHAEPPHLAERTDPLSPIDAFVLARLAERGIDPSGAAEPHTLVRRLYLDLAGLPPSPEVVRAFVADPSDAAYERLVDDLLASHAFAERWARHWLDRARYADSDGYEKDDPRPTAWLYRDWVIDAIDRDLPFDRFTAEQLAGDLVPDADWRSRLGTSFHRQTLTNREGGVDAEEFRVAAVLDRTNTVASVWLGMTYACAQCHDHKYEPISQAEYFALYAFFDNADERAERVPLGRDVLANWHEPLHPFDIARAPIVDALDAARAAVPDDLDQFTKRARADFKARLAAWPASTRLALAASECTNGKVRARADGTLLLPAPTEDTSRVRLSYDGPLVASGIALELIKNASLRSGGPGHGEGGSVALSEVELAVEKDGVQTQLEVATSRTDRPLRRTNTDAAVDGDLLTFWLPLGQGNDSALRLYTKSPIAVAAGERLVVTLTTADTQRRAVGAVRIRALSEADSFGDIDNAVLALVLTPTGGAPTPRQLELLRNYHSDQDPQVARLLATLAAHDATRPDLPDLEAPVISERRAERRTSHVLVRGDFLRPGAVATPGTPAVLPRLVARDEEAGPDRLDLARWLFAPDNPLPLRVAVNQVWQHLFGRGLVETVDDFGVRGERPEYPELLDWLVDEFRGNGLSRKALVRTIVLSQAYRRSSVGRPDLDDVDPGNRLLARQNRWRVEAEIVRDLALSASGLLSERVGGPSVFPPLPEGVAEQSYAFNFVWEPSTGPDRYRRGLYTFFKRTAPHPNLTVFDCPSSNITSASRAVSNTPLQALSTLNNEVYVEAAVALAARVTASAANDEVVLAYAFELAVARPPNTTEIAAVLALLADARAYYAAAPDDAQQLVAYAPVGAERVAAELAPWVATLRVLFNLDEHLTRE